MALSAPSADKQITKMASYGALGYAAMIGVALWLVSKLLFFFKGRKRKGGLFNGFKLF